MINHRSYNSWLALDVMAAMLMYRTIAKKSFGNLALILCKKRAGFRFCLVQLPVHGRLITLLACDRAAKQDFDSVSSGIQRSNPQTQSTLSTKCFLIYYTCTARAYGSYNSRGFMGHNPNKYKPRMGSKLIFSQQ